MRRLMSGFSLAAILFLGGMVGACQPTKPCHCVQSGGCRCPLPPPPKNVSAPKEQSEQTQTTNGTQPARHPHQAPAAYAAPGHEERFARHHRRGTRRYEAGTEPQRSAEDHENWFARPSRRFHGSRKAPSARSGGALSYDYHDVSRSSRTGAYSPPRNGLAPRQPEGEGFEKDRFQPARMSINSPEALDPWRGYDIECPNRDGRE